MKNFSKILSVILLIAFLLVTPVFAEGETTPEDSRFLEIFLYFFLSALCAAVIIIPTAIWASKKRVAQEAALKLAQEAQAAEAKKCAQAAELAQRQAEEALKQKHLSNALIQRVINDYVQYMVNQVYYANRSNAVEYTTVSIELRVAELCISFGGIKGKEYVLQKERYANIPESNLEDVLMIMTAEIISRLRHYFNQYSFGRDSGVSISYYYNVKDRACDGHTLGVSSSRGSYEEKWRASYIKYKARNGNFIEEKNW